MINLVSASTLRFILSADREFNFLNSEMVTEIECELSSETED
jgi:hypothetical protein